jgi:hypothetical protein
MDARVRCPDGRSFFVGDIIYHEDNKANARLIAIAPEMLNVLRSVASEPCRRVPPAADCETWLVGHPSAGRCVRCEARVLLAKAEGRSTDALFNLAVQQARDAFGGGK